MINRKFLIATLGLLLAATTVQSTHAGFVNWEYCGVGEWDSGECWGGFSSPDADDTANIRPGILFNNASVLIVAGDENVAKDVSITTSAIGDTSTVLQNGGSLTIGKDLGDPIGWFGGKLDIFTDIDSGRVSYQLFDGSISSRIVLIGSEGVFDATFTHNGGSNTTEQLQVGQGLNSFNGKSTYQLFAGTVAAELEFIGSNTTASFIQYGGTNALSSQLILGSNETGDGYYSLSGGLLNAGSEFIGSKGNGTFDQTGGVNAARQLSLGSQATGEGIYTLVDGLLATPNQFIGMKGTGSFLQSGGNNTASERLILGLDAGGEGSYTLNGGTLAVNRIGPGEGSGTFNLDGGTLDLTGPSIEVNLFNIGNAAGSNGELNLGAGKTFTSDSLFVGFGGTATMDQSGGTTTVNGDLIMGYYTDNQSDFSAYLISGGELVAQNFVFNRCFPLAQFYQSGGTITIGQTLTLAQYCGTANYFLSGGTLTVGDIVNGTGPGNFSITAGVLQANSIHAEDMTSFGFTGGTLMVDQFLGTLNNQGGTLSPGSTPFLPGSAHITGDYTQSVEGRLYIEMSGTGVIESDTVAVNGAANLAGELQAIWVDGPGNNAVEGDSVDLLTAVTITGGFDVLNLPALGPGLGWSLNVLTDEIGSTDVLRLSVVSNPDVLFEDGFE